MPESGSFLDELSEQPFCSCCARPLVRLVHTPTGVGSVGATRDEAVRLLAEELVLRGEITPAAARRTLGLPG